MTIKSNYNLLKNNTFGINAHCAFYREVKSVRALKLMLQEKTLPIYLLGGGSNVLFTQEYYNWIFIKNSIKGIKIVSDTKGGVLLEIGAGENWHQFVLWAIDNNLGGVENLSLIPGTVGAAPIQNIGAYGVELKDTFVKLEALNLQTLDIEIFTKEECQFGYRNSVFKNDKKGKYCITKVFLCLKKNNHILNSQYGDIQKVLIERNIEKPTIKDISNAVIHIRQSKLPDPSVLGNAGSFFKNPEIEKTHFDTLKNEYPNIVGYPTEKGVKVAAGWLIEQCGWKGKRLGDVGVHAQQALVLVNYGNGKGLEINVLADKIKDSVFEKYKIVLEKEVNVL